MKYIYYSDSGHGWIKVPFVELLRLNIAHKITSFSFHRGDYVYLEECNDYATFEKVKKTFVTDNDKELQALKINKSIIIVHQKGIIDSDNLIVEDLKGFRYQRHIKWEIIQNYGLKNVFAFCLI